ncbi:MAG: DUF4321 domain-containing protein [Chitinispirillales bacterium]|jgi:hypothetical protein|nr:DUF4321 domain-containing protein [Chitinispirillales bacterium]
MAISLKDKKIGTLILVVLIGIIIGSFLNEVVAAIPMGDNVVKTFFTHTIAFGVGDPTPLSIDLAAIRFQFGFQFKFSLLSVLGIFLSLYFFRWYK